MFGLIVGAAVCVGCGDNLPPPPASPVIAGTAAVTLSDDGRQLAFTRGERVLLTFGADAFSAGTVDDLDAGDSFDPFWLFTDPPAEPPAGLTWRAADAGARMAVVSSAADELVVRIDARGARITVTVSSRVPGDVALHVDAESTGAQPVAYLRVRPDADATEGFYGLGEWGDGVEHRGKLRPMQMELSSALESNDNENHVPVPLLLGTRGWGLFVESTRPGVFDVARQTATAIDITYGTGAASADGLALHLFSEPAPLDLLRHYHAIAGAPGLPAPWAYGPLLWRDEHRDQAQVVDDIQQLRSRKLAVSGIWLDRPYARGVQTFDLDPAKFPTPVAMFQALHDAGLRYAVWHAPYTAPGAPGQQDPAPAELAYATAHGYFPPLTGIQLNPWGKPIDFTNPEAYAWWQGQLRRYTDPLGAGGYGIEGWKLDYAEDVVVGAFGQRTRWKFADGSDERTMHHGYQLLYHRVHREVLPADGGFLLARTGRWGDQVNGTIIWPGDLDASFARQGDPLPGSSQGAVGGLPTALAFGIGLSASGFPFSASDTGGYRASPATNECWIRWLEANAVWSAMEIGDSTGEQPWEFTAANGRDVHTVDLLRRYASLHLRLFAYAWSYATQLATTGRPLVRPFGLAYPAVGQHPSDEYLFGDHLLVAPVIAAAQTTRDVWFPPGTWVGWWDGVRYDGGLAGARHAVPADLDTLPLFLAQGGIVPMLRDTIETLAPVAAASGIESYAKDPGLLWVRVAPGPSMTRFTVFDGAEVTQQATAGGLALTFSPGVTFATGALFEVIGTPSPASVHAGASVLTPRADLAALRTATEGWAWEAARGGTLWIRVPGAAQLSVP